MIPSKLNRSEAAVLGDGKLTLRFYEFLNSIANKISTFSTKLDFITITQPVDLDTIESDTAINNEKVSNATHTGEVTGSTALTVDRTAITNKTSVTPDGADYIIISDSSDSGNLKKALISSLPSSSSTGVESVIATVDFGATFTDKASTVVTGETWVTATSCIAPQVLTASGVDPDEMYLLGMEVEISDLVVGDGFTVTVYSQAEAKGTYNVMCLGV